ncbi:MAG: carboxypeptidase-like regulatory domain-containing protein [Candidatus Eremiobacterota bacterium]
MIMLYTNNPPAGYGPGSNATVTIAGTSVNTKSDGSFYITGLPAGINTLTVEHPSYISIIQDVPVADPNANPAQFKDLKITPEKLLSSFGIGGTFQFSACATGNEGTIVIPSVTWSINGDIGNIDSNGIFTAKKAGTGSVKATSGGSSVEVPVTVTEGTGILYGTVTYNNNPVVNAYVRVDGSSLYTRTDSTGHYSIPSIPATSVTVKAKDETNKQEGSAQATVPAGGQAEVNIVLLQIIPTVIPTDIPPTPTITPGGPTLTPTVTPGGPTLTPTPTMTPGGPTLTPTPTATSGVPTLTPTPTSTPTSTPTPPKPVINNVVPMALEVSIQGMNFGFPPGGTVTFNGIPMTVNTWGMNVIVVTSPGGGTYTVVVTTQEGQQSEPYEAILP